MQRKEHKKTSARLLQDRRIKTKRKTNFKQVFYLYVDNHFLLRNVAVKMLINS